MDDNFVPSFLAACVRLKAWASWRISPFESHCRLTFKQSRGFSGQRNFALGRPAEQSSVAADANASYAVDGNSETEWNHRTCAHTEDEPEPFWRVHLAESLLVTEVVITSTSDGRTRIHTH